VHRGGWALVAVFVVGMALSACSSPSTPGVLTQADIPSDLNMTSNSAFASVYLRENAAPRCKKTGFASFSVPGKRVDTTTNVPASAKSPEVISSSVVCPNTSDAHIALRSGLSTPGARSVSGIGSEAILVNFGIPKTGYYVVGWRESNRVGFVFLVGASNDKRITPALAELLARRAAARS
jgi:hypothetical protein